MIAFGNCAAMRKSVTGKLAAQLLRPGSGAVKASGLVLAAVKATGSDRAAGAAKAGAAGASKASSQGEHQGPLLRRFTTAALRLANPAQLCLFWMVGRSRRRQCTRRMQNSTALSSAVFASDGGKMASASQAMAP